MLAELHRRCGPPIWRRREGGYPGLARIIIEQQLSVASANAILARTTTATDGLDPKVLLRCGEEELRGCGLSGPKIRYLRALAEDVLEGSFSFAGIRALNEGDASAALEKLLGVGRWTAAVYLLFCEDRRDLWPRGDVALLAAHQSGGGGFERQELRAFDSYAEKAYAPHRGIAAHLLWAEIARLRGRAPL